MDNLAHTLAGAALGEAGLKKKTGLGLATLMIAANLPDLDALGLFFGHNLAWRRGWTHGPLGLAFLPLLLAGAMLAFDRWQAWRGTRPAARPPVRFGWLLALAYIGALSHPLMDFLNTYGIRFLMPFSDRWYYGDALFIIDVWLWLALGAGIWLARRRSSSTPAIVALTAVTLYAGAMGGSGLAAERIVAREVEGRGVGIPDRIVASPVPFDPFERRIVYRVDRAFGFATLRWTPSPRLTFEPRFVPTNMDDPAIELAGAQDRRVADFLYWSRLPFAEIERADGAARVTIGDARYNWMDPAGRFTVRATVPEPGKAPARRPTGPAPASRPAPRHRSRRSPSRDRTADGRVSARPSR
jgi:inner membrane protein